METAFHATTIVAVSKDYITVRLSADLPDP